MTLRSASCVSLVLGFALSSSAEEQSRPPVELKVIKASIGVWDAEIEVWPQGPDSPSMKFKGVETNRPYGEHWLASDFDSEFGGQTLKMHSIVGYDLDSKKMVGTIIDHGPHAATMTGTYDEKSKTVQWITKARDLQGKPILQRTLITQENENERVLVLMVPGDKKDEFTKFMRIRFVRRK